MKIRELYKNLDWDVFQLKDLFQTNSKGRFDKAQAGETRNEMIIILSEKEVMPVPPNTPIPFEGYVLFSEIFKDNLHLSLFVSTVLKKNVLSSGFKAASLPSKSIALPIKGGEIATEEMDKFIKDMMSEILWDVENFARERREELNKKD